ncbi:Translin [Ceratobasidium sp. AG-Ba]|nr:Translin [Ceratobasidium sp. AG-Ba]QRW14750.1 Translin [Ceratobasidium sp. AG-Ba]
MSDDEYFDNDEIFNSAELDSISFLNEPSTSDGPAPPAPLAPLAAQPSSSHRPSQSGVTGPSGSRFSAIMNALKKSVQPQSQPQAGPSNVQPQSVISKNPSCLGSSTGLLDGSSSKETVDSSRRKREDSSSGSESPSGCKSPRKRTRRGSSGSKRLHKSPSKAILKDLVQRSKAEGGIEGEAKVWAIIEEELQCAICCDILVAPQTTPCGHTGCATLQSAWFKAKSNCPMCRGQISSSQKPADNLICANMIDRMFKESPEWHPNQPKRVEWDKRKQEWDKEVAQSNSRARRYVPARAPAPAPQQPQRPLFNPDPDSEDDDSDSGVGFGSDFDEEDENFQEELLNEIARQGGLRFRIYDV